MRRKALYEFNLSGNLHWDKTRSAGPQIHLPLWGCYSEPCWSNEMRSNGCIRTDLKIHGNKDSNGGFRYAEWLIVYVDWKGISEWCYEWNR
ncbi:hypothetical protein JTE90_027270 [Oedothorax gibbosus]|uniref:Uncharacterized protein n=1 Tax=Oedothorax gibbosus TaxID=931172 RepID=A0AAV6W0D4_9ARAC|nr:hypothetical protein JTE90_027270 [Oedothorax gibbosus]